MDNYYVELNHRDLLVVSGEDSSTFLQGQVSCDLDTLADPDSCPGCLCDNKGRVIASFTLWKISGVFYLEMEAGVATIAEQHLKKYSVFYKSEITINNDAFYRVGIMVSEANDFLTTNFPSLPHLVNQVKQSVLNKNFFLRCVDPVHNRYELWLDFASSSHLLPELALTRRDNEAWVGLDQLQGLYRIKAEDSACYTPQELNYDMQGHISFSKGCYTGQEIVARMHYRGKAKKRLYLLNITSDSIPEKYMKIINTTGISDGKTVGEIIEVTELSENYYQAQAIMKEGNYENLELDNLPSKAIKVIPYLDQIDTE